jgi:hypothetical protein
MKMNLATHPVGRIAKREVAEAPAVAREHAQLQPGTQTQPRTMLWSE